MKTYKLTGDYENFYTFTIKGFQFDLALPLGVIVVIKDQNMNGTFSEAVIPG